MPSEPTVFIVDDDPAVRDSVAALVRSKGYAVEAFASAEAFLASLDRAQTGCIVADLRMTGMSGLELQERLQSLGIRLPLIMITGYGDVPTAVRAMRAGAFSFLEKPCRDHELWATIQHAIEQATQGKQAEQERSDIEAHLAELSPEERKVMQAMLAGKQNKIIAAELDIGLRTVELRRANVLKKMQATSLAELVRMALLVGVEIP